MRPGPDGVSAALRALWGRRSRELAGTLASGGRSHLEIAKATRLISEDYHDRFLIELIQNANDQAARAGLECSTVVIVRTQDLIAVTNGGSPVTETNLARVTSLADSDKSGTTIGNKGVGFKAVYQVTDAPEIYSAPVPTGPGRTAASVFDALGVGAALSVHPGDDARIRAAVEAEVRAHLVRNAGIAEDLEGRYGADPARAVVGELANVAGFKFPLPRTWADWEGRAATLALPDALQPDVQTAVVLPLRDAGARSAAGVAIRALTEAPGQGLSDAALTMLFLPSVDQLVIIDRVEGAEWRVHRRAVPDTERTDDTELAMREVITEGPSGTTTSRFWLASVDALDAPPEERARRAGIVTAAVQEFGLEGWSPADPLPVAVALPCPDGDRVAPLGPSGRLCLGLPTQQETGLPAHVDARFYARINRTGLAGDHTYNALLLDVAAGVFATLVRQFRGSDSLQTRRAATLALVGEPGHGVLADRVFREGAVGTEACVLDWSGARFRHAEDLRLPGADDLALLPLLQDALEADAPLPERGLLEHCSRELEALNLSALDAHEHPWLSRDGGDPSLIERLAAANRAAGRAWWTRFITAVLPLARTWDLADQRVLPVGQDALASADERAYLPTRGHRPEDLEEEEDEVPTLPGGLRAALRMLDDQVLPLREGPRADYSPLARALRDQKLVRDPRKDELLNDVIFPGIDAAASQDEAFDLWFLAMDWLSTISLKAFGRLKKRAARVPVLRSGGFAWVPPEDAYLGDGWGLDTEHESLLQQAYPAARVPAQAWIHARHALDDEAKEAWRSAFDRLGVNTRPRVLELARPRKAWPLVGAGGRLSVSPGRGRLQDPDLDALYAGYLGRIALEETPWSWTFSHDIESVCWLDGLESPERRAAVIDLVLLHPSAYLSAARTQLKRVGHNPVASVSTLWAHAVTHEDWAIFPIDNGAGGVRERRRASETWQLPARDRRPAWADLLPHVSARLGPARALLEALGVPSTQTAGRGRLFRALDDLARRLQPGARPDRAQLSLATELYRQLDRALKGGPTVPFPSQSCLPMRRGRQLRALDLKASPDARVLFDDDPARGRHLPDRAGLWVVPLSSGAAPGSLVACFAATLGPARVLQSATAPIALPFTATGDRRPFLDWLDDAHPRAELPVHLAALLAFGGDRSLGTSGLQAPWERLQKLQLERGTFTDPTTTSFYDGLSATLRVSREKAPWQVLSAAWPVVGQSRRDLWEGYARALHDGHTLEFLADRDIGEVELTDAAEAAGLQQTATVVPLACAVLAAWAHREPGRTLDDADRWWEGVSRTPQGIAEAFGAPDLVERLRSALHAPPPTGELTLLTHLGVPVSAWQAAVARRDGTPHRFKAAVAAFERARDHLVAIARALAAAVVTRDLAPLSGPVAQAGALAAPDAIAHAPLDTVAAQQAALDAVAAALEPADIRAWRDAWPQLSAAWPAESPIPAAASKRDVTAYRDTPAARRRQSAVAGVQSLLTIAQELAAMNGETIDPGAVLGDHRVAMRLEGDWAHPYAALSAVRAVLLDAAPRTTARLSKVRAFHEPRGQAALRASLPELADAPAAEPPKTQVLEISLGRPQLRAELEKGAFGRFGERLRAAAQADLDPSVLARARTPFPAPRPGTPGGGSPGTSPVPTRTVVVGARVARPPDESALTGDLGEAFMHEWLKHRLGDAYPPDAWRSKARVRYGVAGEGDDTVGYDFEVPDPAGTLFGVAARRLCIEVKSTATDGAGAFPMSAPEWATAVECHEARDGRVYVIVRVVHARSEPRIGDVLVDPVEMERAGTLRRKQRDLWISVAPRGGADPPD